VGVGAVGVAGVSGLLLRPKKRFRPSFEKT
jgi:hypothetical protein